MLSITKRIEFDYGHRVLGHQGKCRFLHGHRGVAEFTITTPNLNNLGMVMDFGHIKHDLKQWIDQNLDHNMIFNPNDPLLDVWDEGRLVDRTDRQPFTMPDGQNPTAENLAVLLFDQAALLLPEVEVVGVRFYETPNSYADYCP